MPIRKSHKTGSELFIIDNSTHDWRVLCYLHDWCQFSKSFGIATSYFEIGALMALGDDWQQFYHIRVLMGDEVSKRTPHAPRRLTTIDTTSAVFKDTVMAHRSARQAGEMDHLAFMAAFKRMKATNLAKVKPAGWPAP